MKLATLNKYLKEKNLAEMKLTNIEFNTKPV